MGYSQSRGWWDGRWAIPNVEGGGMEDGLFPMQGVVGWKMGYSQCRMWWDVRWAIPKEEGGGMEDNYKNVRVR